MLNNDQYMANELRMNNYKNSEATVKDIKNVTDNYKGLKYTITSYAFANGHSKNLAKLSGTIPVMYKKNTYYIPICIWLMDTHPENAPLCYVEPTSDMKVNVSMYVDQNGKIYLPYLYDWNPSTSDLLGVIQVMICIFGENPPVFKKQATDVPYPTQSFMPQPGGAGSPYGAPYTTTGSMGNFPPYPPYSAYPSTSGINPSSMSTGVPSPWSGGMPMIRPTGNPSYSPTGGAGTGTITEQHIKASLISAIEDKLRRRISENINQYQAEIQAIHRTKQELSEGKVKIMDILSKLEREENELTANITVLKDKEQALEKSLESLEKVDGIDVDEAITTTAPLYRQLLNAYAEEAATEDAIYYMGEALRSGVIDLEVFLKHVRQLSRKQFMLRAIMQKCRQKAGLAG